MTGAVGFRKLLLSLSFLAICVDLIQTPLYLLLGWRRLIASVHGCISARCCIRPQSSSSFHPFPPVSLYTVLSTICKEANKQFTPIPPFSFFLICLSVRLLLCLQLLAQVRLSYSVTVKGPGDDGLMGRGDRFFVGVKTHDPRVSRYSRGRGICLSPQF